MATSPCGLCFRFECDVCIPSGGVQPIHSKSTTREKKLEAASPRRVKREAARRGPQAGTCRDTYLCGSCVHVWARPDKGTVVDSTHLLHKCKEPDPAFCKRNINTVHEERCPSREASFHFLEQCRSIKSIRQSANDLQICDKLLWCWLMAFIGFLGVFFPGSVMCELSTGHGRLEFEFITFHEQVKCRF